MSKNKKVSQTQSDTLHIIHSQGEVAVCLSIAPKAHHFYRKICSTVTLEALYKQGLISLEFPDKDSWRTATIAITEKGLEALNSG